jgi:predicted transcriptional regulator
MATLQEDTYFRVMRILQVNPDLTQRELAEKLGISVGGLNYCLKALMEKGLVKMQNSLHPRISLATFMYSPQRAWLKRRPLPTGFYSARWTSTWR